jgi:hypothetical protein
MDRSEGFERARAVPELRSGASSWIFASFDPGRRPSGRRLEGLRRAIALPAGGAAHRQPRSSSDWNWKVMVENFDESYHHAGPHRETLQPIVPARGTFGAESDGPWAILHNPSGDGTPVPALFPVTPGLSEAQRADFVVGAIFPFHLFSVQLDSMFWYHLEPGGAERFRLRIYPCVPEAALREPELRAALGGFRGFVNDIHLQDIEACQGVQRGLRSRLAAPGPALHRAPAWQPVSDAAARGVRREPADPACAGGSVSPPARGASSRAPAANTPAAATLASESSAITRAGRWANPRAARSSSSPSDQPRVCTSTSQPRRGAARWGRARSHGAARCPKPSRTAWRSPGQHERLARSQAEERRERRNSSPAREADAAPAEAVAAAPAEHVAEQRISRPDHQQRTAAAPSRDTFFTNQLVYCGRRCRPSPRAGPPGRLPPRAAGWPRASSTMGASQGRGARRSARPPATPEARLAQRAAQEGQQEDGQQADPRRGAPAQRQHLHGGVGRAEPSRGRRGCLRADPTPRCSAGSSSTRITMATPRPSSRKARPAIWQSAN